MRARVRSAESACDRRGFGSCGDGRGLGASLFSAFFLARARRPRRPFRSFSRGVELLPLPVASFFFLKPFRREEKIESAASFAGSFAQHAPF